MQSRGLLVSKGWVQAVLLVVLFGFFVLGLLAYRTYDAKPPIPERAVDANGRVVFTAKDVQKGQQVFLHNGLMEYGSAFGHGAYLGPDYTADYLRRSSDLGQAQLRAAAVRPRHAPHGRRLPHATPTTRAPACWRSAAAQAGAHQQARGLLQPLLLGAHVKARSAA